MNIRFKSGRIPVINSVSIPEGQSYSFITLGEPCGSPSFGYTARVYDESDREIGSALNQMNGRGWSVNVVGSTAIEEQYRENDSDIAGLESSLTGSMKRRYEEARERTRTP